MAPTKLRRAIEAVKDQSSIGLAKVNQKALLSDLDIAIVKATRHDEYPAEGRHINIILNLTCYSSPYVRHCVKTISRRLRKTRNWMVALKTLMLIHRLLHDGDIAFEQELYFTPRYGTCLLDMSDFRDKLRVDAWNYSVFVRTYALYLNNQLLQKVKARKGNDNGSVFAVRDVPKEMVKPGSIVVRVAPVKEMKMDQILTRAHCLMETLKLFLNCRPTGTIETNRLVVMALYPAIKESYNMYYDITEIRDVLIGRFKELDISEAIQVHEILCRISTQLDELEAFYKWSTSIGIARCSENPEVVKIPQIELDDMEKYIQEKKTEKPETEPSDEEPPIEGVPEETEKESETKIYEVDDLINLDDDDCPTAEEHPDRLALSLLDGPSTTQLSQWDSFSGLDDWEKELERSANNLPTQNETSTGGFGTMLALPACPSQTDAADSTTTGGFSTMLALPACPSQTDAANSTMVYPNYAAPMPTMSSPYVQMSEMEMKQRLQTEQQMMWNQYSTYGIPRPVAYTMGQPQHYMYNQGGGYTTTY